MADIKNDATLSTSLVSVWLSDNSSVTADLHGSNDLTNNNGVTSGTGKNGTAGDFVRSSSQYLSISDASQSGLEPAGDFSVAAWVNCDIDPSTELLTITAKIVGSAGNRHHWFVYFDSGGNILYTQVASKDGFDANDLGTGTWHHVGFSFKDSTNTVVWYVDGSSVGSSTSYTETPNTGTAEFAIGSTSGGGNYWDGLLHQVVFWSKTAASTEFAALYNSGDGIPYEAATTFIPTILSS